MTDVLSVEAPSDHRGGTGPVIDVGRAVITFAVGGVLWALAVAMAPLPARSAVAWCAGVCGVLLAGTVAIADRRVRRFRQQARRHLAAARRHQVEAGNLRGELETLAGTTLPWVLERLRQRDSAATILAEAADRLPHEPAARQLAEQVVELLYQDHRRLHAMLSVMQESAQRVNASVTDQLAEISRRKQPYWEENSASVSRYGVREDFEALDVQASALRLLAQRLLALTGARRIGRPWPRPIELQRVLRAAIGSTEDYLRVHSALPEFPVAVVSPAVNDVIHVLAEIIDNGLRFSAPTTRVWVSVEHVPAGVLVHVDDSGLTMSPEMVERARRTVDLSRPVEITDLSGARLGLVAARIRAERHAVRITFGSSPSGGTRVGVLIPQQLLTRASPARTADQSADRGQIPPARPSPVPRPQSSPAPAEPPAAPPPEPASPPASSPKLARRTPGATMPNRPSDEAAPPPPPRTADETARRLSSLRAATRHSPNDPPMRDAEPPR
ncbi:ATP-binding protein [Streptomyces sp. NRRL F-5053]|uniref:ATP-binding protein n=1 Tax=Streptomyces sp. NRRL F-5053 TaxID=1463854 RepID=UPI0004CA8F31|nr:ATP-binding protein [Streptomyces sp. NRRL F-5053]